MLGSDRAPCLTLIWKGLARDRLMARTSCLGITFCAPGLSQCLALQGPVAFQQDAVCGSPVHACMKELRRPVFLGNHAGLLFGQNFLDERARVHGHSRGVHWQQRVPMYVRASTAGGDAYDLFLQHKAGLQRVFPRFEIRVLSAPAMLDPIQKELLCLLAKFN